MTPLTYTPSYTGLRMWWRGPRAYVRRMLDGQPGRAAVTETTVTQAVLAAAREHADRGAGRPALVDPHRELDYGRFAASVPAAATGLRRLGVRTGDVAAIHVTGVCDHALAVHAVTAAGAVPAPLPATADVPELAAMMTECGARFLLTGAATAAEALAATERSYVRQVFAFGNVPGATPFARLVEAGAPPVAPDPGPEPVAPADPLRDLALRLCDPPEGITHAERLADLHRLGGAAALGVDDVLACHPGDCSIPTWAGLVDLCLLHGATLAAVPEPGLPALLAAIGRHRATTAVVTPAKLRALAFGHAEIPVGDVRLLVTGRPDQDVLAACRARRGWIVVPLG